MTVFARRRRSSSSTTVLFLLGGFALLILVPTTFGAFFLPSSSSFATTKRRQTSLSKSVNNNEQQQQQQQEEEITEPLEEREPQVLTDLLPFLPTAEVDEEQLSVDENYMRMAIQMAQSDGGENGATSAYPQPTVGAVLVTERGKILAQARSDYQAHALIHLLNKAGLGITPLADYWCVTWPASAQLRQDLASSTLYLTLEPTAERQGTALPPLTQLISQAGIPRVVIGTADPVRPAQGAACLHANGVQVSMMMASGGVLENECLETVEIYSELAKSKLHTMARNHFNYTGRPLGFLHCSVVDSDNLEAFARHGNAFGTDFGGKRLSFRDFGAYEIAPPPEVIWAEEEEEEEEDEDDDDLFMVDFEEEDYQGDVKGNPMMPWYQQVNAVVATFPRLGNGPDDARLNGLKWLATHGNTLPAGVERILVMDATDLSQLPWTNDDARLLNNKKDEGRGGVDIEAFWQGKGRKPTRVLLRRGTNAQAKAAAEAAAKAAASAAQAAKAAAEAIECGDAELAAQAALDYQASAEAATAYIQNELQAAQSLRQKLQSKGVIVETINGGEPVDVMQHLGQRSGYQTVVWRAGCWGERGVKAIMAGAFQWVSAHLAVDAMGGRFWQLMLAENAVQAACGPQQRVKVFADQEDISLEYCDNPNADSDCSMSIDGRPVRHIRLDCRIALVQEERPREFVLEKTKKIDKDFIAEEAPWFL